MNNNLVLCVVLALVVMLMLSQNTQENFSESGLNMSDRYCNNLVDGYYNPQDQNPQNRMFYRKRICSPLRRMAIDGATGNYYTNHGKFY
tara:strand:+ start:11071 stop:11337 length:267 start_codon:yes stop_codon:yes gene_type:complete